jgi:hypothetical protein
MVGQDHIRRMTAVLSRQAESVVSAPLNGPVVRGRRHADGRTWAIPL